MARAKISAKQQRANKSKREAEEEEENEIEASADEEEEQQPTAAAAAAAASSSDESEEEVVIKKKGRATATKRRKVVAAASSDEEEEASAAAAAAAAGSDDDDDAQENLQDKYDKDLYIDEEDKEKLAAMPAMKREDILYERSLERMRLKETRAALHQSNNKSNSKAATAAAAVKAAAAAKAAAASRSSKARQAPRGAAQSKKDALADMQSRRKRDAESEQESEENSESEGEQESEEEEQESDDDGNTSSSRKREQKNSKKRAASRSNSGSRSSKQSRSSSVADSESDGSDSEQQSGSDSDSNNNNRQRNRQQQQLQDDDDEDDNKHSSSSTALNYVTVKHHLQLLRRSLERLHDQPYFVQFITSMFVMINISSYSNNGNSSSSGYRVGQVLGTQDFPLSVDPYEFPYRSKRFTRTGLLVQHGNSKRVFQMTLVSDGALLESEWDRWLTAMKDHKQHVFDVETAMQLKRKAEALRSGYQFTTDILADMADKKKESLLLQMHMQNSKQAAAVASAANTSAAAAAAVAASGAVVINHNLLSDAMIQRSRIVSQLFDARNDQSPHDSSNRDTPSERAALIAKLEQQLSVLDSTLARHQAAKEENSNSSRNAKVMALNAKIAQKQKEDVQRMRDEGKKMKIEQQQNKQQAAAAAVKIEPEATAAADAAFDNTSSNDMQIDTIDVLLQPVTVTATTAAAAAPHPRQITFPQHQRTLGDAAIIAQQRLLKHLASVMDLRFESAAAVTAAAATAACKAYRDVLTLPTNDYCKLPAADAETITLQNYWQRNEANQQ